MSLKLIPTSPIKSLIAAFLKVRPLRSDIETFKANLINLHVQVDVSEMEENQKTHLRDFLVNTSYMRKNKINTKYYKSCNEDQNQENSLLRDWLLLMLINGQVRVGDDVDEEMMWMATEPVNEYTVRGK